MSVLFLVFVVSCAAKGGGQDPIPPPPPDLSEIEMRLGAIEAEMLAHDHEHQHEHIVLLQEEIDALRAAVDALTGGEPIPVPINIQSEVVNSLEKRDAFHYMRISLLEYDADSIGELTKCWDTGGVPDRDMDTCHCPDRSTWYPDSDPLDDVADSACRWDDGTPASEDPEPDGVPSGN